MPSCISGVPRRPDAPQAVLPVLPSTRPTSSAIRGEHAVPIIGSICDVPRTALVAYAVTAEPCLIPLSRRQVLVRNRPIALVALSVHPKAIEKVPSITNSRLF